ncbi:hypothetical protein U91I_00429 [alpha proteobacterium U9-1i]|nr:hypothetical protein U91I_00429 [alpha proteobacterium U9-1i]
MPENTPWRFCGFMYMSLKVGGYFAPFHETPVICETDALKNPRFA